MIFGFQTDDEHAATAALAVYVIYRSRDRTRFKVTPDMWGRIETFVKDAAKRAQTVPDFIEALKRPGRMNAPTMHPRYLAVGLGGATPLIHLQGGALAQFAPDPDAREFGLQVFETADHRRVREEAYRRPSRVIALVRDRLEREKPVETLIEDTAE